MEYLDFNFPLKKIPKAFFLSTFYYTFIGVSDLCFASKFPCKLHEVGVGLQKSHAGCTAFL